MLVSGNEANGDVLMATHELFAYLCVSNAAKAIEFYCEAFGATEKFRLSEPGGRIGHAELDFDGNTLLVCEEFPECGVTSPNPEALANCTVHLHVDNADEVVGRALALGAKLDSPLQDHFYGERSASFRDPFGHRWNVGHSIEEVSTEEMQRRYTKLLGGEPGDS